MKILLINPPWFRLRGHISTEVPMGLCYIAAQLEKDGNEVQIWNADFSPSYGNIRECLSLIRKKILSKQKNDDTDNCYNLSLPIWRECREIITSFNPDYIGITTYTCALKSVLNIVSIAKEFNPQVKTILGGPHATIYPSELIEKDGVDFVVVGEGETPVQQLISGNGDFSTIEGLFYKTKQGIKCNSLRSNFENVNMIPFPAKHLVIDYQELPPSNFRVINSSRGCPFGCIFCCSREIHGRKVRFRDAKNVVDEIEYTRRRFGTHYFFFCDDTFTANPEHAESIIDEIIKRKLNVFWSCQTRPERIDDSLAAKMKKAGCKRVWMGVETGNPRIRKLIKKGNTLDDIERCIRFFRKHKIDVAGFFMFGFPTETVKEMYETIHFMKKINPSVAYWNIVIPYPETELMLMMENQGLLVPDMIDWSNFDHQSYKNFISYELNDQEKKKLIDEFQSIFYNHNRSQFRKNIFKRMPFYFKLIMKERLYRQSVYSLPKIITRLIIKLF